MFNLANSKLDQKIPGWQEACIKEMLFIEATYSCCFCGLTCKLLTREVADSWCTVIVDN